MVATSVSKILLIVTFAGFVSSVFASPGRNATTQASSPTHKQQVEEIYQLLEKQGFVRMRAVSSKWKATPTAMVKSKKYARSLRVTATAYTSHVDQTDSTPNIAAWGDRLKPGMKSIAVSRDLLTVYGLKHKQKVRIKGLEGEYVVLDKMNKRWRKKIDIYMGMNKRNAYKWGRRKVEIQW